ncbi:MAG: hypothetical protein ACP5EQ_07915, partial [Candidatus Cloacimonadia bacterium]
RGLRLSKSGSTRQYLKNRRTDHLIFVTPWSKEWGVPQLSVLVKDDVISLLIVEAKDMHKGSQTQAEKQLKDSMQNMGLSQYLSDPKIKQIRGKGAYIFSELKVR